MRAKDLYLYATDQATAVVMQVLPEQLRRPTPNTEWDVRELLEHMLHDLDQTVAITGSGRAPDVTGKDLLSGWLEHAERAERAVEHCPESITVHDTEGDEPFEDYLWAAGNHQLMHAWDLGQAIGVSVVFDEPAAQALYDRAIVFRRRADGASYGPLVPVPDAANTQTKLLAAMGRSEDWVERMYKSNGRL